MDIIKKQLKLKKAGLEYNRREQKELSEKIEETDKLLESMINRLARLRQNEHEYLDRIEHLENQLN